MQVDWALGSEQRRWGLPSFPTSCALSLPAHRAVTPSVTPRQHSPSQSSRGRLLLLLSRGVNSQFVVVHECGAQEGGKRRGREILNIDDENKAERAWREVFISDLLKAPVASEVQFTETSSSSGSWINGTCSLLLCCWGFLPGATYPYTKPYFTFSEAKKQSCSFKKK